MTSSTYVTALQFTGIPVGHYKISGIIPVYGGNTGIGHKRRIVAAGGATISGGRGVLAPFNANTFTQVANIAAELSAAHSTTPAGWFEGNLSVTVAGDIVIEVAQITTDAANPASLNAEAHAMLEWIRS